MPESLFIGLLFFKPISVTVFLHLFLKQGIGNNIALDCAPNYSLHRAFSTISDCSFFLQKVALY